MSDLDATTPRVFLVRHGETEWTKNGRYTGTSDIPLTEHGLEQVASTAKLLVGPGKLVDPSRINHIWVSPRKRAKQTFECLFPGNESSPEISLDDAAKVTVTERIAEWDYGNYEGLLVKEIRQMRKEQGLDVDREWNVWADGCVGGEKPEHIEARLDRMIHEILELQRPHMNGQKPADIVLVAHGLILRCFMKRWLNLQIDSPFPVMFSPGAIGILSYKNRNPEERGFYLGVALPTQT